MSRVRGLRGRRCRARQIADQLQRVEVYFDNNTFAALCEAADHQGCTIADLIARSVANSIHSLTGTDVAYVATMSEGDER